MKGFNVKKLAAIATGVALLGSAVAPIVSATNATKGDIYNSNGSPNVNIVIGSEAALSDAVWAGNLAAKIAEKASTTRSVSVSATGEGGGSVGDLDLSDLTVDVTIGGTVTFGAGTKKYNVSLNSGTAAGDKEVLAALDGTNDTNALTDATLSHLHNATIRQKVSNGDQTNQTTNLTVQEKIGINVDAKFDGTDSDVYDLVGIIDSGDFSYLVTVGASTTGVDLGSTSFTDGSNDDVEIVFFGEKYELSTATLTGSKSVKLVKASARETYNEGETIEGLVGDNEYNGEDLTVKVVQIVQTGAATTTYEATFELYDPEGNLIDTRTATTGENLRDVFKDSGQDEALASNLFVDTIAVGATTGIGYVEITKGTDTVELFDGKIYPYDSTHTGSKPYNVVITTGSSDANSLYSIKITNSAEVWEDPDGGSFDLGPLYPTRAGQSVKGNAGKTAAFLESLPDGTQGKGYATVEFLGFEGDEEKTVVEFGKDVSGLPAGSAGGIKFRADDDSLRELPFYIKVNDANTTFQFENKTISVDYEFGNSKTGTRDVNIVVNSADYVNGRLWTITQQPGDTNAQLTITGVGPIGDLTTSTLRTLRDLNEFTVDGVTFKVEDANTGANTEMIVSVDTVVEFIYGDNPGNDGKGSATFVYNGSTDITAWTDSYTTSGAGSYGRLALTNKSTFDGNVGSISSTPVTVGLYGSDTARRIYYAAQYNENDLWLLLDADKFGAGQSDVIQNSHAVSFLGTRVPNDDGTYTETSGLPTTFSTNDVNSEIKKLDSTWAYGHYVPKQTDFNSATLYGASDAFLVAEFQVNSNVDSADINVYIDTSDGGNLGPYSIDNLTGSNYTSGTVRNLNTPTWNLKPGTDTQFLKAGYTDAGTKAWLLDETGDTGVKVSMPQTAEKVDIVVSGPETLREVSGGETLTLAVGAQGTTDGGTQVTVEAVNGGSCGVAGGDGSVVCSANPESYNSPAAVRNPLVYLDSEAPSGTNIIIGGHIVNRLASGLADRLTAPGQTVAEVDASTGDIYLAGYTAQDTGRAVQELIDDIDGFA